MGGIEDLALLGRLDPAAVMVATAEDRCKAQLAANTAEAIADGVIGPPELIAEGKRFFGNDRLDLLNRFLAL